MFIRTKSYKNYHKGKKISKYDKQLKSLQKERLAKETIIQLPNGDFAKVINTS